MVESGCFWSAFCRRCRRAGRDSFCWELDTSVPDRRDWVVALGSNRSFYVGTLRKTGDALEDWELVDKRQVVDLTELVDHGIKKCPDGSYLHAASGMPPEAAGETGPPTDYLHLWRYDEDFNVWHILSFEMV